MGTWDLPDIYALTQGALGYRAYIKQISSVHDILHLQGLVFILANKKCNCVVLFTFVINESMKLCASLWKYNSGTINLFSLCYGDVW